MDLSAIAGRADWCLSSIVKSFGIDYEVLRPPIEMVKAAIESASKRR